MRSSARKPHREWDVKTGTVKSVRDGDGTLVDVLETDGWSPWEYHLPEEMFDAYHRAADSIMTRLERMPLAVRRRLDQVAVRCPIKGCLLATIYEIRRRATPEERQRNIEMAERLSRLGVGGARPALSDVNTEPVYFYVGRTTGRTEVYDILNYPAPHTAKDDARGCSCCRILYWRAGCRHGTATLARNRMYELFSIAHRVCGPRQSEQEAVSSLPEHDAKMWGKRTFHPDPKEWHPKR